MINCKFVTCDVRDGSLISQHEPYIEGVNWIDVPDSEVSVGSYYQVLRAAIVPEFECKGLEDHCTVHEYDWVIEARVEGDSLLVIHDGGSTKSFF